MSLNPNKLHVNCLESCKVGEKFIPRRYTLTHSDSTGDLFLTINCDYDEEQISKLYTRFMRDEVLAEWIEANNRYELHIYVHVSGGFVFGWAKLRERIFKFHMPLVLKALIYGDKELFDSYPTLKNAPIFVHFSSKKEKYNKVEDYGRIKEYNVFNLS
ncbi:MAG: staygreen family protein [Candidatus Hodarchaeota archaeon]